MKKEREGMMGRKSETLCGDRVEGVGEEETQLRKVWVEWRGRFGRARKKDNNSFTHLKLPSPGHETLRTKIHIFPPS